MINNNNSNTKTIIRNTQQLLWATKTAKRFYNFVVFLPTAERQTDIQTDKWMDGQVSGQMIEWIKEINDRQRGGRSDGWTDIQTDSHFVYNIDHNKLNKSRETLFRVCFLLLYLYVINTSVFHFFSFKLQILKRVRCSWIPIIIGCPHHPNPTSNRVYKRTTVGRLWMKWLIKISLFCPFSYVSV